MLSMTAVASPLAKDEKSAERVISTFSETQLGKYVHTSMHFESFFQEDLQPWQLSLLYFHTHT